MKPVHWGVLISLIVVRMLAYLPSAEQVSPKEASEKDKYIDLAQEEKAGIPSQYGDPGYTRSSEEEKVNWDKFKIEYHLYWHLIEEGLTDRAEIHERMGYGLIYTDNQWERATVHFKKAVELDPKRYLSWYNLALAYIDTEESNEYFRKAIEAKPDYPPPYYWLAYNYCRNRRDEEAAPLFKKYLEVAKGDANEEGRIATARQVLKDLRSGKEGRDLKIIRRVME